MLDYPEKSHIVMSFQSCVHPLRPVTKDRIRGETHIAGYVLRPSTNKPNSTDLCVLSQVDIKVIYFIGSCSSYFYREVFQRRL